MANRHLSRQIALQTLFEGDFREYDKKQTLEISKRNIEEFSENSADNEFVENLVESVLDKQKDLDRIITKAAPDWPIDKISTVDRNILRIGLFELLFADRKEVPPKVAINEAIELAKSFGGETSGKFVNGVLGAVYKELGEPGKDDQPKKKIKNIPDSKTPIENLYGAVVFAETDEGIKLALVHDVFGHWTLSKGHGEKTEDDFVAVKRIVNDELNLDINPMETLGNNEYIAYDPEKGKIRKRVTYYLAETSYKEIKTPESGGLNDAKWFSLSEIPELNFYDDILPLVTKAIKILAEKNKIKA